MKTFRTAIMALALLWGLSGCAVTPGYPTYGAYPYGYPACTAYSCPDFYGGPAYYGPGSWYPYYGSFFLGGYYSSYDRHHHKYYPHAVRAPHPFPHRYVTVDHRRHSDRHGHGDRVVTAPPRRVPEKGDRHFIKDRGQLRRPSADFGWREHRKAVGNVLGHERPGQGGDFRRHGDGKLRCGGARC